MKSVFLFLFLIIFCLPVYSQEENLKLDVDIDEVKTFQIENDKSKVVNDKIAKIIKSDKYLIIKGVSGGNTPLFIWNKNKIKTYIVNVNVPKIVNKISNININNYSNSVYSFNPDLDYGSYTINTSGGLGNSQNKQNIINNFSYSFPFLSGRTALNLGLGNTFLNANQIEQFTLNNIGLKFLSKNINLSLGDIFINSSGIANIINSNLKGGQLLYQFDQGSRVNLFSGLETPQQIDFYSKNTNIGYQNYVYGGSAYISFPRLNIFSDIISKNSLLNNDKLFNFSTGIRWNPLANVNLLTSIGTNLKGIAANLNGSYLSTFETGDWIKYSSSYLYSDKNYLVNSLRDRHLLNLNIQGKHLSGLNFSGSYAFNRERLFDSNQVNMSLTKNIDKSTDINVSTAYTSFENITTNSYGIGINSGYILPMNLNYNFTYGKRPDEYNENLINSSILFLNNEKISLSLINFLRNTNYKDKNLIRSNIFGNVGINTIFKIYKKFSLGGNISYGLGFSDISSSRIFSQNLGLQLNSNFNLSVYHQLSINLGLNVNNESSLFSSINYTYSFGKSVDQNYKVSNLKIYAFEDSNDNKMYDDDEKIIPNIKVTFDKNDYYTNDKEINIDNLDYGNYEFLVDKTTLPKGFRITEYQNNNIFIQSNKTDIMIPLRYEAVISGYVFSGQTKTSGLQGLKIVLDQNKEVKTDSNGYYFFVTTPGKHNIKIDYLTIPTGYKLSEKLSKEIDIDSEDFKLDFVFDPQRNIKIFIFIPNDPDQRYSDSNSKPKSNFKINVKYNLKGKIVNQNLLTDSEGFVYLKNIDDGEIKITFDGLEEPITIDVPDKKFDFSLEIPLYK